MGYPYGRQCLELVSRKLKSPPADASAIGLSFFGRHRATLQLIELRNNVFSLHVFSSSGVLAAEPKAHTRRFVERQPMQKDLLKA